MAEHAWNELVELVGAFLALESQRLDVPFKTKASKAHETCNVEVLIIMTKGSAEDLLIPLVWATPKAMAYWEEVAAQNMMGHAKQMEGYVISNVRGKSAIIKYDLSTDCWSTGAAEVFSNNLKALRTEMKSLAKMGLRKSNTHCDQS